MPITAAFEASDFAVIREMAEVQGRTRADIVRRLVLSELKRRGRHAVQG